MAARPCEAGEFAFRKVYKESCSMGTSGGAGWRSRARGAVLHWEEDVHLRAADPPFFADMPPRARRPPGDVVGARVLALLGDSVTTDHISPAGFHPGRRAGRRVTCSTLGRGAQGLQLSTASRRGNHEVMMRGTFANIRLRNQIAREPRAAGRVHLPDNESDVHLTTPRCDTR